MTDFATKSDIEQLRAEIATKDDLAQLRQQLTEDMKMHVGTLYEKFSGDVTLLSEQIAGMDRRLGRVEKKVEVLTETVGEVKIELSAINDKLDRKADKAVVRLHDRRIGVLEAK